ncbi:SusC/RagA family TonB-linked outer membrane protein [Flavobacterium saccharophilum]|uniref:TonB-linked outer membrane protein, SusC/RagA family n=1 Tax=Flavobacterium saccharophilum TaxID=29534 RepID=A0A1M7L955_9FLAO|nr:TonB-dependent receptor [Flavobacterium saccharophilum]SHM73888.1 TonB-linked outer membrane protein, SusC/RagA family [Flavobacterium saccharophilum]
MKLLIKDKPKTVWLTSEIWKFTKLTPGFLLAMTLQVSAATESKDTNFFLNLHNTPSTGSTATGAKNETILSNYQKTIKGTVTGSKGEPLPGVNILVKGTNNVVTTDFDGKFSIDVPDSNSILVVSFTGFVTKEVRATDGLNIQLEEENQTLNEVVVVGYGTQKKASTTGAIASIKGGVLTQNASANVSNGIAGRMSGVIANNRSGRPGDDSSSLLIRGFNSFGGGTSPLVVVDGIPDRDLNRINPDDIESVTVLKDASAAIYGVRSANGVILVTTKRGKVSAPTIKIDGSYGIQQLTRMDEKVNSWQYMTYYNELNAHKGTTLPYAQSEIDKYKAGNDPNYTSTNWLKEVYRKDAPQSNVSMSVNGGTEQVKYFFSGQYLNQESNLRNSDERYRQFNLRSNIDVNISSNLKVNLDIATRREDRNYPAVSIGSIMHETVSMYPFIPAYWKNGLPSSGISNGRNPILMSSSAAGYDKVINLIVNPKIGFDLKLPKITEGLSLSGYAAFDYNVRSEKKFTKPWDAYAYDKINDSYNNVKNSTSITSVMQDEQITNQNTYFAKLAYDRKFNKHSFNAFVGYEQTTTDKTETYAYRRDLLSDKLDQIFTGSTKGQNATGSAYQDGRESYLGRVAYNFDNKYFAEVSARYNGSFNFPSSTRWGMFPSVSAGWKISEEDFFKNNIKAIDQLKIRASWGKMGNDDMRSGNQLNQYLFLTRYQLITDQQLYSYFGSDYTLNNSIYLSSTPNPNITWEVQDSKNIGFDFGFFNNKLTATFDYFSNKRSDILTARNASVPLYTGLALPKENIGETVNRGTDWSVNYADMSHQFKYSIGLNFTYAQSEVLFRDEAPNIPQWQKSTGKAIDSWMVYQTNGIYRTQADVDNSAHFEGAKPGDLWVKDTDGDGSITTNDQVRIPESATPKIAYGIPMRAEYKGFSIDMLWTGQAKAKQMILPQAQGAIVAPPTWLYNDRYTADNPDSKYPVAFNDSDNRNNIPADFWLRDASFFRLKSLEVSYVLPENALSKFGVSNVRFYAGGTNLFSFDHMKQYNLDPETNNTTGVNYPQTRIYRIGVSIQL